MNIKHYLERINYQGDTQLSLETLKSLQEAHLLHVPFENLDIHYGNPIELDLEKIYEKVVEKGRGGFCYELNGLFRELLKELGFDARIISARVYNKEKGTFAKEYGHLAILVNWDEAAYLVDVGFGEFAFHPLQLVLDKDQADPRGVFIVEEHGNGYYRVSKIEGKTRSIEYIFSGKERAFNEFAEMCIFHQSSPDSPFTRNKLITRPVENGRITLTDNLLKITEAGQVKQNIPIANEDYGAYLHNWFHIHEKDL